jgi:hypothetical protein
VRDVFGKNLLSRCQMRNLRSANVHVSNTRSYATNAPALGSGEDSTDDEGAVRTPSRFAVSSAPIAPPAMSKTAYVGPKFDWDITKEYMKKYGFVFVATYGVIDFASSTSTEIDDSICYILRHSRRLDDAVFGDRWRSSRSFVYQSTFIRLLRRLVWS